MTAQRIRRRDDVFVVTARTARDNPLLHFQATIFHFIQQREFGFTVRHAFGLNFNLTQNVGQVLVQRVDFIHIARVEWQRNHWFDGA